MNKGSITLTYNAQDNFDGTGAQVQRILGIFAICRKFGFNYHHTPILNLVTHPLDSFQNSSDLKSYLEKVNRYFDLPSNATIPFDKEIKITKFTKFSITKFNLLRNFSKKRNLLIKVSDPSAIIEENPDILKFAVSSLKDLAVAGTKKEISIVLHIRRDVHRDFVITGESLPRSLPIDYYKEKLRDIIDSLDGSSTYRISIFTDIPKRPFLFTPQSRDFELWRSAGHEFVDGKIHVDALDLEKEFIDFGPNLEIYCGGDPLHAIIMMSASDYFVMSRSSLSYLVGILNQNGEIIYPPKFWAAPLSNWKIG